MTQSNLRYAMVQSKSTGHDAIKLLEEPYSGIIFTYGKVRFEEDTENDKLKIHFEYELLDDGDKSFDKEIFQQYLGVLLQELIREGLMNNNLTYTGGINDEDRTGDIIESDSE